MKTGYKAFKSKGMICKGKEYKEHTTYEEDGNDICESGALDYFEDPFDMLSYYPLVDNRGDFSEFAQVESLGDDLIRGNKSVSNKLYIRAKLSFKDFIEACVDFILEKTRIDQRTITNADINTDDSCIKISSSIDSAKIVSSGNSAKIVSSGYYTQIGSFGDFAQISSCEEFAKIGSSGKYAKIISSEDFAQIGSSGNSAKIDSSGDLAKIVFSGISANIDSSGYSAKIGSSGDSTKICSSGDCAKISSSGNHVKIYSSGDFAQIGSSGESAKISSDGKSTVVIATGTNSMARAKIGSWITLAEWVQDEEVGNYIPKCVKTEYVDGAKIKEDTFYKLLDGEFKEI